MRHCSRSTSEVGVEEAQVVVERELHVHVQRRALRAAGTCSRGCRPARDRLVAPVVDAVDEAGEPQHVFGHALAPLATRGGARQRLAQRLRGLGEHLGVAARPRGAGELSSPTCSRRSLSMSCTSDGEPLEVAAHGAELVVDQRLLALEILGAETALGREHLLVHAQQLLDRQLRAPAARAGLGASAAARTTTTASAEEGDGEGQHLPRPSRYGRGMTVKRMVRGPVVLQVVQQERVELVGRLLGDPVADALEHLEAVRARRRARPSPPRPPGRARCRRCDHTYIVGTVIGPMPRRGSRWRGTS